MKFQTLLLCQGEGREGGEEEERRGGEEGRGEGGSERKQQRYSSGSINIDV